MTWHASGVTVHSGATPAPGDGWVDFDLTEDTGGNPTGLSGRVLAVLQVTTVTGTSHFLHFRPSDATADWESHTSGSGGVASANFLTSGVDRKILVPTGPDGHVEWSATVQNSNETVVLEGWLDINHFGTGISSGGSGWNLVDVSAIIGAQKTAVYMTGEMGSVPGFRDRFALRVPNDTTLSWGHPDNVMPSMMWAPDNGDVGAIVGVSDGSGIIETYKYSAFTVAFQIENTPQDFELPNAGEELVYQDTPANGTVTLDLTTSVGGNPTGIPSTSRTAVLYRLDISGAHGSHFPTHTLFDPTYNVANVNSLTAGGVEYSRMHRGCSTIGWTFTNDDGTVSFKSSSNFSSYTATEISILGFVRGTVPPVVDNQSPGDGGLTEDPDTDLVFDVTDADGDLDTDTIDLTLEDPDGASANAIVDGVFQSGYSGTISAIADGVRVTLSTHPLFRVGSWTATVYAEDEDTASVTTSWTFTSQRYIGDSRSGLRGVGAAYPLGGGELRQGYLWREEFLSRYLVRLNRGDPAGLPSFAPPGVALNGSDQHISYDGDPWAVAIFARLQQTWDVRIWPDFEADDGAEHVIFDADQDGSSAFSLRKQADNTLLVRLGFTDFEIALGTYQSEWTAGERVRIVVSAEDGDTSVWVGSTKVLDGDSTAWDYRGADGLFVGVDNGLASGFFDGVVESVRFLDALVTNPDDL